MLFFISLPHMSKSVIVSTNDCLFHWAHRSIYWAQTVYILCRVATLCFCGLFPVFVYVRRGSQPAATLMAGKFISRRFWDTLLRSWCIVENMVDWLYQSGSESPLLFAVVCLWCLRIFWRSLQGLFYSAVLHKSGVLKKFVQLLSKMCSWQMDNISVRNGVNF